MNIFNLVTYTQSTQNNSFMFNIFITVILIAVLLVGILAEIPILSILSSLFLILFASALAINPNINISYVYDAGNYIILTEKYPFHPFSEIFFVFLAILGLFSAYRNLKGL